MAIKSSKHDIASRTRDFWQKNAISSTSSSHSDFDTINAFLELEYQNIPAKERIGKGSVYISKVVAETVFKMFNKSWNPKLGEQLTDYGVQNDKYHLVNFGVSLTAQSAALSIEDCYYCLNLARKWACGSDWELREISCYIVRKALAFFPDNVLKILNEWINSTDENLIRLVTESLRPLNDIKWLRDPQKVTIIFPILTRANAQSSEYVRKSVGNVLKDLTKYMPSEILTLLHEWLSTAQITVTNDLASKTKRELGEANFYLIWTCKHALRWLRERQPDYHMQIEQILGKNYVLYFHEKKNKLALPKKTS